MIFANYPTLLSFQYMLFSDVLIIAKSAYSYLAGLFNKNSVYYMDFWHNPLQHWKHINELIQSPQA